MGSELRVCDDCGVLFDDPACPVCAGLTRRAAPRRNDTPFWRRPAFVAEQAKWYARLARSGFEDLEYQHPVTGEPREFMRRGSLADLARLYRWDKVRYFEWAQQFALTLRHGSKRDPRGHHRVWRRYAKGVAPAKIAAELRLPRRRVLYAIEVMQVRFNRWLAGQGLA